MCSANQNVSVTADCDGDDKNLSNYFWVFVIGQIFHGIGGTSLFTVAVSLIDDSVMPKELPFKLGFVYGFNMLGAGSGFIIGGQFLNFYVDFDSGKYFFSALIYFQYQ